MKDALSYVSRIRSVWIIGFAFLGFTGCIMGVLGYLALYLREIGWSQAASDGALAAFNIAGAFGSIPIAMLSDRLGIRKPILFSLILFSMVSAALIPFFNGGMVWVLSIILGFTRDPAITLFFIMNLENKKVGVLYAGTAMGLMNTVARFGAAGAPVVGNWLADFSLGMPFFFWAALSAASLVILCYAKETGWRKRKGSA
jgi:predicted MFS family arabinose efflux permease